MGSLDVGDMQSVNWFDEARYGMFIHWGPYSVAARGEWVMNRERIPVDEYTRCYADHFTARNYDPKAWAQLAIDVGFRYVVLTARHHDGFALWPTKTGNFHSGNHGAKCDLVGPFVQAVRDAGLKVGLYYSVADWTHPDYPDPLARSWPSAWHTESARQRFIHYYRAQLEELLTQYGPIDILWYDGCIPQPLEGGETNGLVRGWQPNILINDRLDVATSDFRTCEQVIGAEKGGRKRCQEP